MPNKPKSKKKKKVSYETRIRRLKEYRANLSDEQKQKIKEYNRARSLRARANETPLAREMRLEKSRESARIRRTKRKAQAQREMRKLGLVPQQKTALPNPPPDPNHPFVKKTADPPTTPTNNNLPSVLIKNPVDMKYIGLKPVHQSKRVVPPSQDLPYINYKPAFRMNMPQMGLTQEADDMATVCPIECNVDISPEPSERVERTIQKFKQPANVTSEGSEEIVKNIGAHVVLKKKVMNRGPPEDVRLPSAGGSGPSDWNGFASVCPIECNVDITDPSEPSHQPKESSSSAQKRNSLLDSLKQMGTHVIIKKKGEGGDKTAENKTSSYKNDLSRILPVNCSVDIKPVESRIKNSEITIVKRNGSHILKKPSPQIVMQKVKMPTPFAVQEKPYDSPEEYYDDYDLPCPIECNVDISESS